MEPARPLWMKRHGILCSSSWNIINEPRHETRNFQKRRCVVILLSVDIAAARWGFVPTGMQHSFAIFADEAQVFDIHVRPRRLSRWSPIWLMPTYGTRPAKLSETPS